MAVNAYILIEVPAPQSGEVVKIFRDEKWPEVVEAHAVFGQSDVVAKVRTASIIELNTLLMDRIQGIKSVESTRTFITIDDPKYSYSAVPTTV